LSLQLNADKARAAKNLGTEAGVTTFDAYDADGKIEGGNAFWTNLDSSPSYRALRFNLGTGDLSSSTTTTGTYSAVSLALPSTSNEYGAYGESLSRNNGFFAYKDAKTICLSYNNYSLETGFATSATAYGNKFMPSSGGRSMFGGLEAPQAGYGGSCGNDT
jgi:hypothetical protein